MRMIVPNLSILFFFFEILPCSYNATVRFREENRGRNRSKSTCTGSFLFDFVFLPLFFSPGFLDILFLWDHIQSKASSKKKVVFNQTTSAWTSLVLPSIYGHRNPINADCIKEKQTKIKAVETRWYRQIKQFKKQKKKKQRSPFLHIHRSLWHGCKTGLNVSWCPWTFGRLPWRTNQQKKRWPRKTK